MAVNQPNIAPKVTYRYTRLQRLSETSQLTNDDRCERVRWASISVLLPEEGSWGTGDDLQVRTRTLDGPTRSAGVHEVEN